ncbi:zinc finger protein 131-like isoform X2 [Bacillus rossius redtenbacheri]|uniref:zinc finger protein 131-like isoform X2 n=1 Tax=Bacillus rossius redtenbacheri TaxID=93214 RepID=UPI002FDCF08A
MTDEQQFCLRWNNFQTNITSQFEALRNEELFVDVTLACEGQRLKAHKVVLSACSPYFKELFTSNPCKHPILFMRDVEFCHLRALVEFMYAGEVNVAQAQLTAFLRTAESLHIRGLTETPRPRKEERLSPALDADVFRPDGRKVEEEGVLDASPPLSPPPSKRPCRSATPPPLQLPCRGESPDIIEPKLELPDYGSDGECRVDGSMSASMFGLDNSIDGNTSLSSLHGSMDTYPGTSSQNFMADFSQDSSQDLRKLHSLDPRPCPICFRMYSNLSNLRQHVRLIHNPQTVACPLCSKPFKTKLYLKRHLMSFHELACSPAPQVVLGPDGPKVKDEFFQHARAPLPHFPFPFPGDERPPPNGHGFQDHALGRGFNKSAYLSRLFNKPGDSSGLNTMLPPYGNTLDDSQDRQQYGAPTQACRAESRNALDDSHDRQQYGAPPQACRAESRNALDDSQERQQYGAPPQACRAESRSDDVSGVMNDAHSHSLKLEALDMQSDVNDALLALSESKRDDTTSFLSPNILENTPSSQAIGN